MKKLISILMVLLMAPIALACNGVVIVQNGTEYCKECADGLVVVNNSCILSSSMHYEPDAITKGVNGLLNWVSPDNQLLGVAIIILVVVGIIWYCSVERKKF